MLYLTSDHFSVFVPLGLVGFYRYLWYILRLLAAGAYRPIEVPENPTYVASEDVTIIVPTIDADDNFAYAASTWLAGEPYEVLIITETSVVPALQALANRVNADDAAKHPGELLGPGGKGRVRVLSVPRANKRLQMAEGIRAATTDIIVFADDDALWPRTMLPLILACFEDQQMGGVGTSQVVVPVGKRWTVWEMLAAFRLSIRNIEIRASTHIDGGIPCLSGRTAAYRTLILKDPDFLHGFTNDYWLDRYHLNSGDDKFLTRWMVSHGWSTYVQCCKGAELQSTMKPDWRFLKQVLRWTRNTWRSDLRSIFMERHIWRRHPYVAYTMIDKFLNPFTLLAGPCLVMYLCVKSTRDVPMGGYNLPAWNIVVSWCVWLTFTRALKLAPHLWSRPQDIIYVPVWVLFGYYFAVMKLYALCTLHETGWGTREGVGETETRKFNSRADKHTSFGSHAHWDSRNGSTIRGSPYEDEKDVDLPPGATVWPPAPLNEAVAYTSDGTRHPLSSDSFEQPPPPPPRSSSHSSQETAAPARTVDRTVSHSSLSTYASASEQQQQYWDAPAAPLEARESSEMDLRWEPLRAGRV